MASSEQLSQAALIYEQAFTALRDSPKALSDTTMVVAGRRALRRRLLKQ